MADLEMVDLPPRLKEGIELLDRGLTFDAQTVFEGYLEAHPDSALALSFVGMLRACAGAPPSEGLDLCQQAVRQDPDEPLCYLNLAKAYMANDDRYQCVRTIHRGLKYRSPHRQRLLDFYRTIGIRRKPPLPFLSRDNPLNEFLGRLTWRLRIGGGA
ncbi:MAG: hypothetical protein ACP5VN_01905 [Acidobacteriota bacterium]